VNESVWVGDDEQCLSLAGFYIRAQSYWQRGYVVIVKTVRPYSILSLMGTARGVVIAQKKSTVLSLDESLWPTL
jgi:hypothetical protein